MNCGEQMDLDADNLHEELKIWLRSLAERLAAAEDALLRGELRELEAGMGSVLRLTEAVRELMQTTQFLHAKAARMLDAEDLSTAARIRHRNRVLAGVVRRRRLTLDGLCRALARDCSPVYGAVAILPEDRRR
jgi:hypothetical protein